MFPLLLIGAILKLACPDKAGSVDLNEIGTICLWVGGVTTAIPLAIFLLLAIVAVLEG